MPVYSQQIEGARDAGRHVFETALLAGAGDWRSAGAVRAGWEFNTIFPHYVAPLGAAPAAHSFAGNTAPGVVLAALKRAEDGSGALVARTVETHGVASDDTWTGALAGTARSCNLLETESAAPARSPTHHRPWEIKTLRLPA